MRQIHVAWAWVVISGNGIAGLWALGAHKLPSWRTRALWWFTGAVEVAIFIQVALGVALVSGWSSHRLEPLRFHMFYGFVALISVAIISSYRAQLAKHRYLLYGFGGLFLMGLGLRAVQVGPR